MKATPKKKNHTTGELHPRNRHREPYDFPKLTERCPELARFVVSHLRGGQTIDFSDAEAVMTLNRALLKFHYGVGHWSIPPGYLCPPIPSRADYLHYVADLLAGGPEREVRIPRGSSVRVLDIGVGANCVYPLIGAQEYGWSFVGTDIDRAAVAWVEQLVAGNPALAGRIEARWQSSAADIFRRAIKPGETFAVSICNPPFHASPEEAAAGTLRKLKNLGGGKSRPTKVVLNFGGRSNELWCEGGEIAFVQRMIVQSAERPELCGWFTTLVSKQGSLPFVYRELKKVRAVEVRTIPMFAGQKQSRMVAWRF